MSKTLSLCQGKGCLAHNNRTFFPKNVDRTRTPDNVVFIQKPIKEAYEELFDDAVQEYNSRQITHAYSQCEMRQTDTRQLL